jgi:zinc protease
MRRAIVFMLIALFPAVGQLPTRAQEPGALPKAETVLADYIEATGGKAAYEKVKSRTLTGTVELPGANINGKIQIFQAAPNQLAVVTEIGPAGKTIQATDGKSAWESSAITGERLLDGAEKEDFIRKATFNEEIHRKELYEKLECVGIEDVEGKPAYKLVLTAKTGKTETEYYDKTSHLLVKETTTAKGPMGEFTVESFPSDYKRVDGLLIPFKATQKVLNQELVIKLTEIKHDAEIPADTFKRPASLDGAAKKKID